MLFISHFESYALYHKIDKMEKIQLLARAGNYSTWDGDPSPRWFSRFMWNWRLFLIQERAFGGNAYWSYSHSMHLTCTLWHDTAPALAWAATLWTGSRNWSRKTNRQMSKHYCWYQLKVQSLNTFQFWRNQAVNCDSQAYQHNHTTQNPSILQEDSPQTLSLTWNKVRS